MTRIAKRKRMLDLSDRVKGTLAACGVVLRHTGAADKVQTIREK